MRLFETIYKEAQQRSGSLENLNEKLPVPFTEKQLVSRPDNEYLSLMARRVFRAGLKHEMVDAKWPAFEEVFHNFGIQAVRMMSDESLEALMQDKRIIRHWGKIKSVRANAQAIHELQEHHESVGRYLANWPGSDIVGLWNDLSERFTQLGGNSGPYFLRMAGKDTFILTKYVVKALIKWGVLQREPKGKKARQEVQMAFNQWVRESGKPLCQISMILAQSVD